MKVTVDKEIIQEAVDALRDISIFLRDNYHIDASRLLHDVLISKNKLHNILIINPDPDKERSPWRD